MKDINLDIDNWYESRFTGIFANFGELESRPYDPAIAMWAGSVVPCGMRQTSLTIGGAGFTKEAAQLACIGEAIERLEPYPLAQDQSISTSFDNWHLDEPAIEPETWVLFLKEQYQQLDFPFKPFSRKTICNWVCFRDPFSGSAFWIPEEIGFLYPRSNTMHQISPSISTGLSCGRNLITDNTLLRAVQEVIERDALVGGWWGSYKLQEWDAKEIFKLFGEDLSKRILRPNLKYRFYRINTPFSAHVSLVTVEGQDKEGYCFSAGAACRETRTSSWLKSLLEAAQGRYYVRYLKAELSKAASNPNKTPTDFPEHAVYYTLFPEQLPNTVLYKAETSFEDKEIDKQESLEHLKEKLGNHKILFRLMTPPSISQQVEDWHVVKVVIPGLQPLHGDHRLPHLGGKLWAQRTLDDWKNMSPHPFA